MNMVIVIAVLVSIYFAYKYIVYFSVKNKHLNGLQYKHKYWTLTNTDSYDVDKEFYLRSNNKLLSLGFIKLADLGTDFTDRTYISVYKNPESTISVSLYSLKTDGLSGYTYNNSIDFESETRNGEFYATTNAWLARHIKLPKEIHMTYLEPNSSIETINKNHIINMIDKSFLTIEKIEDVIASQDRMNKIKAQHREIIGETVTMSEIKDIDMNMKSDIEKYKAINKSDNV